MTNNEKPVAVDAEEFSRLADEYDLLVLDVHGVVLNRPWTQFLHDVGDATGEGGPELEDRWRRRLRLPFWEGRLAESDLWEAIAPAREPAQLRADLERRFAPGPIFDAVADGRNPIWLLSNHRTDWLIPRLDRFGLTGRFERVIVSDQVGAAKPDERIYRDVVAETSRRSVCFVDDQIHNTAQARSLGVAARHITASA